VGNTGGETKFHHSLTIMINLHLKWYRGAKNQVGSFSK